jgi:hypothetical protein
VAGPFEGFGNHALVLWAGAGAAMVKDFSMRGHETAKRLGVLVVHSAQLIGAEITLLLYGWFGFLRAHKICKNYDLRF